MAGTSTEPSWRDLLKRYAAGDAVSAVGGDIRIHLDPARPFLLVQRRLRGGEDAPLVRGEAAHIEADQDDGELADLVKGVVEAGAATHGAFLVLEVWEGEDPGRFRVLAPSGPAPATVETLSEGLEALVLEPSDPGVVTEATDRRAPPGAEPLLTVQECHRLGCLLLGLEVPPVYREASTGHLYPLYFRHVRRGLSRVLREALFEFVRVQTGANVASYRALGRRSLGDAVWESDRRLAEIEGSFDLLLLVSPVNQAQEWRRFRENGFERPPEFRYRLLPLDPDLIKREIYELRLEEVEDPAAAFLLRDKREELDKRLSMLTERSTPSFVHSSIRLYGHIGPALLEQAREILERVPPPDRGVAARSVDAAAFAARAEEEFAHYRARYADFASDIQIRPDLVGLMVSSGNLLIGETLALSERRVEPLIHHEVGTHVLTYVNGAAQPLRQLSHGLADYDELQEGMAVMAEYLVGGLDAGRMRLLAARVLATHCLLDGAAFIETFRRLHRDHGFSAAGAFGITARIYQSGGFTRDVIYLRGLLDLVRWIREGGELRDLYIGKLAVKHVEVIAELRERGVLREAPLTPRFLEDPEACMRLDSLRPGIALHEMIAA